MRDPIARGFQKTASWGLVLTLVLYANASEIQEVKYKSLQPGGEEFSVEFPGEPQRTLVYVPLGSVAVRVRTWDLIKNNIRYQIVSFPKDGAGAFSPDASFELFTETVRSVLAASPNLLSFDRKIVSSGGTALQYQIRVGDYPGVLRLYGTPKRFYAVLAIGAGEADDSVSRFLSTFEFENPKAASVESFSEAKQGAVNPPSFFSHLNFESVDTVVIGILNGKAVALPTPKYPPGAKGSGRVLVRVMIDERGVVTSAVAVDGPSQFHVAAAEAALKARFNPVSFMGRNVKVSGILSYAFKSE